jgi:hypothetical protein
MANVGALNGANKMEMAKAGSAISCNMAMAAMKKAIARLAA